MAEQSGIEWTEATWNPWYCCSEKSAGCEHCYARQWAKRTGRKWGEPIRAAGGTFWAPTRWQEGRRIFVCSLSDFFHARADDWRWAAWAVMAECIRHTFLILTKRPERILDHLPERERPAPYPGINTQWPWPHVWLGATVENSENLWRIDELLKIPAAVRFISCEPLLGPLDLSPWLHEHGGGTFPIGLPRDAAAHTAWCRPGVDWVIVGGETGPGARPMDPGWVRSIHVQCKDAGVPFFFKGWGQWHLPALHGWPKRGRYAIVQPDGIFAEYDRRPPMVDAFGSAIMLRVPRKAAGRLLDSVEHNEYPQAPATEKSR